MCESESPLNNEPQNPSSNQTSNLGLLLSEMGNEVRTRRDAEHLYTAATIGAVGALAWGVAAVGVSHKAGISLWEQPAIVGAAGSVLLGLVVVIKIIREHFIYSSARDEQIKVAKLWTQAAGLDGSWLPAGLAEKDKDQNRNKAGRGYFYSIGIVSVSAIAAAAFCISVFCAESKETPQCAQAKAPQKDSGEANRSPSPAAKDLPGQPNPAR